MSLLDLLQDEKTWRKYLEYKSSLVCHSPFLDELQTFIDNKAYMSVCDNIGSGKDFPLPRKAVINKQSSKKSRTIYIYPRAESIVLKLLTYLLLRRYDCLFCPNLYSFRPNHTAKDAFRSLIRQSNIEKLYAYKVDISNYFNSVPVERLLPMLRSVLWDDTRLCDFLTALLSEEYIKDGNELRIEQKGIMAGTPLASFYANLYLTELDRYFFENAVTYIRYSDDIIVLAETEEKTKEYAEYIRCFLRERGLSVNSDKECFYTPESGFTFLGFCYKSGKVDIAPVTVDKLKAKMRRKTRALMRWSKRKGISGEKAARAFIRIFNSKLLESPEGSELSWSYWFFSVINTTNSLRVIDNYAQDCIRYLYSGTHTKARFNVRYGDLKALGYRSTVNGYYSMKNTENKSL